MFADRPSLTQPYWAHKSTDLTDCTCTLHTAESTKKVDQNSVPPARISSADHEYNPFYLSVNSGARGSANKIYTILSCDCGLGFLTGCATISEDHMHSIWISSHLGCCFHLNSDLSHILDASSVAGMLFPKTWQYIATMRSRSQVFDLRTSYVFMFLPAYLVFSSVTVRWVLRSINFFFICSRSTSRDDRCVYSCGLRAPVLTFPSGRCVLRQIWKMWNDNISMHRRRLWICRGMSSSLSQPISLHSIYYLLWLVACPWILRDPLWWHNNEDCEIRAGHVSWYKYRGVQDSWILQHTILFLLLFRLWTHFPFVFLVSPILKKIFPCSD